MIDKVVKNYLVKPEMLKLDEDVIIEDSKLLGKLRDRNWLETFIAVSSDGKDVKEYLGVDWGNTREVSAFIGYIVRKSWTAFYKAGYTNVKNVIIEQVNSGVKVTINYVLSLKLIIFFKNVDGVYRYAPTTSYNIGIRKSEFEIVDKWLNKALVEILGMKPKNLPIHKVEYWFSSPLSRGDRPESKKDGYVGFRKSDVDGEYDMCILVE